MMSCGTSRVFGAVLAILALVAAGCPPSAAAPTVETPWGTVAEPFPFVRGPYLMRVRPSAMTVVVAADIDEAPVVEWWPLRDRSANPAPPATGIQRTAFEETGDQWSASMQPLTEGSWYGYRVRSSRGDDGPNVFRAGKPNDGIPFRVGAFGDTRTGHKVHRAVIEALAKEEIDFVLHTGDMVDNGGVRAHWDRFFQIERPLLRNVPIFPTIGNHDMNARDYYGQAFLMAEIAGGTNYYHADWGNLRIVAVDSGVECRKGCTQNNASREALAEGARLGMLMIIFLHHPPYSSGAHGSNRRLQVAVGELARTYGVEMVMAGHDHDYERTVPIDGTTYVVASAAGAPIRAVKPHSWTAAIRTEPHYALIDVFADRLEMRALNLDGEEFDAVVIPDNPPRPKG